MACRSCIENGVSSDGHRSAENDEGSTEFHVVGDDSNENREEACSDVRWCGEELGRGVGIPKLIDNLEGMGACSRTKQSLGRLTVGMKMEKAKTGIAVPV
jgi:hypothetical protein